MGVHKLILFFLRVIFKNTTIHKIQLKKHKENLNKKNSGNWMEFSTINESSLHKELKNLYCLKYNGKTEVSCEGHVYDILTKDNNVIEIQTKNLRQLLPKIDDALEKGHKVTVVHPVVITKTIKTYNLENKCISSKKSPKKGHIYDLFRELTGIFPVLLNKNFTLEIPEINIIETREKKGEKVQTLQKSRRYKRDWIKTDKKLDSINSVIKFTCKKDYINLLPCGLAQEFCAKDINNLLIKDSNIPKRLAYSGNLILWVLLRMEVIKETQKKGRTKYYCVN